MKNLSKYVPLYFAGLFLLIVMPYGLGFVFAAHHIDWDGLFASVWVYTILFVVFRKHL